MKSQLVASPRGQFPRIVRNRRTGLIVYAQSVTSGTTLNADAYKEAGQFVTHFDFTVKHLWETVPGDEAIALQNDTHRYEFPYLYQSYYGLVVLATGASSGTPVAGPGYDEFGIGFHRTTWEMFTNRQLWTPIPVGKVIKLKNL